MFAAAFAAGAVLAYSIDRVVDVHVVQVEPQVESEPIFVALRSLPQGAPVTVWDVALKDWPKAMLPTTALKAHASFEGLVLRHPIREGQPLLSGQLARDTSALPAAGLAALHAASPPSVADTPSASRAPAPADGLAPGVERFVPATPSESPLDTAAAGSPPVASASPEPVPAAQPAPLVAAQAAAAGESAPETGSPAPAIADTDIADTDIDAEPTTDDVEPADVAVNPAQRAATPPQDDTPALVAIPEAVVEEPVPTTASPPAEPSPTLVAADTAPQLADVHESGTPLAAPVPALPTTDIERSLAQFGDRQPAAVAESTSVLDRTIAAQPPTPERRTPKLHLVVPERIALAADASFAEQSVSSLPSPPVEGGSEAVRAPEAAPPGAAAPAREAARTKVTRPNSSSRNPAASARNSSASARKPTTPPRQPSGKPQPAPSRHQAAQGRGFGAWFPQWPGSSVQR